MDKRSDPGSGLPISIRPAEPGDAAALVRIYRPYVEQTAITYDLEVPGETEFARRIEAIRREYPFLCILEGGQILGYAYAQLFHNRAAYRCSAEVSIYLDMKARGRGLGRRLYEALERELMEMSVTNAYACIAWPEQEDAYLTKASGRFHAHMGYVLVGTFRRCAHKFGRAYGMIYMEKRLAPGAGEESGHGGDQTGLSGKSGVSVG